MRKERPAIASQLSDSKPLGNLKTLIKGAHKAFKFGSYASQYLSTYAYRFNRHVDLQSVLCSFLGLAETTSPTPERHIRGMVEVHD